MTETARPSPVILLVVTDENRASLEGEFSSRYGRDYDVRVTTDVPGVTDHAASVIADGQPIALIGVDFGLDIDAVDVLDVLRNVSPSSRRIVLTPFGMFQQSLEELRPALAVGRLDTYLLIPGAEPGCDWLPDDVARDENGFVVTGRDVPKELWRDGLPPAPLETTVPGIFAAGDVRSGSMKRVASASGEGAGAVSQVHTHLAPALD